MEIIKKYWYIIVLIIILIISFGFFIKTKENKNEPTNEIKASKEIEEYAIDYFNKFISLASINKYEVTVKMLKEVASQGLTQYDIEKLNKCEDETAIVFEVEPGETNYKSYKNEIICKN